MERLSLLSNSFISVLAKRTSAIFVSFLSGHFAAAQTDNISGVVNSYYQVIEVIPAKAGVRLNTTAGLVHGNLTLLVQMKGATINNVTGNTFGDTISLNNAGNYEVATVCAVIDDTVFFFHNLINNYSVDSKVQLVKFSEHVSADVVDTVKAAPWDSVAGTGGVIAIRCDQDLTLTKPIYADSGGFGGGSFLQSNGTCSDGIPANNYAYNGSSTSPQNGAFKGEGTGGLLSTLTGGRGAPANGGGGGNNHNNSGGGGANLNPGGIGGGNSSNGVACTVTRRGEAGKSMSSWGGTKIFMGGGGGAGHSNNGLSDVSGGNGGGIIFIWADNLIGNNELISANGAMGGNSLSDGAGGGGAGGTIIMHVANYTGNATIRSNGGAGGDSNDGGNIGRCFGGGGGGSGGAIYFTGVTPGVTIAVNGGAGGIETNRDVSCDPVPQAAGAGSNGQTFSSYTFIRSTDPAGYCALLLPSKLISFSTLLTGRKVTLSWQVLQPELVKEFIIERKTITGQWVMITTVAAGDQQQQYTATDNLPLPGANLYRLRVTEKSNSFYYSAIKQVRVDFSDNAFSVYPNPATTQITIRRNRTGKTNFKLSDISGKPVIQTELLNTVSTISLPVLAPGIYLAEINGFVQKLMIR